jgi:hypothetical protein
LLSINILSLIQAYDNLEKEFDLLLFGKDCIINIELKSISTEEKIFKQLERNKYYLSFIEKNI